MRGQSDILPPNEPEAFTIPKVIARMARRLRAYFSVNKNSKLIKSGGNYSGMGGRRVYMLLFSIRRG